jgi:hypothetical protein
VIFTYFIFLAKIIVNIKLMHWEKGNKQLFCECYSKGNDN